MTPPAKARAGGLIDKMNRGTNNPPPTPEAPGSVAPVKPPAAAARDVVGRFTVRLYNPDSLTAWTAVRSALGAELGRIPSQSEVAEIAARVLLDSPEALTRAVELLRADRP